MTPPNAAAGPLPVIQPLLSRPDGLEHGRSRANWLLTEFLDLVELRGRSWCFVNMGEQTGFHPARSGQMFFHAILDGAVRITTAAGQVMDAGAGEIVIVLPGIAHKIRNHQGRTASLLEFPITEGDVDQIPVVRLGDGNIASSLLSGCVDVIWPGGVYPGRAPTMLTLQSADLGVDLQKFAEAAAGPSAPAILTRLATMMFVTAFRNCPRCRAQFRWNLSDPIVRAKVLIEWRPFKPWTVKSLASEVGMGRSNFAARFAAQIGQTPIEVLTDERMKHAEILLRSTNLKIAEISERVGFKSEPAFIHRFATRFGLTPSRWRRVRSSNPQADAEPV